MFKKRFLLLFLLIVLFYNTCFSQKIENNTQEEFILLDDIADELFFVFPTMDKSLILNIANKITETEISSENGLDFLKLKLFALTYCGEYEDAFSEVVKGIELYPNDHELLIAEGFLCAKLDKGSTSFYLALEKIENELFVNPNDQLIIFRYWLRLLLFNEIIENSILEQYKSNEFVYDILWLFSTYDINEVILAPPIHFIIPKPLIINRDNNIEEWWLMLD